VYSATRKIHSFPLILFYFTNIPRIQHKEEYKPSQVILDSFPNVEFVFIGELFLKITFFHPHVWQAAELTFMLKSSFPLQTGHFKTAKLLS